MPEQPLGNHWHVAVLLLRSAHNLPIHFGQVGRRTSQDLEIKVLLDLLAGAAPTTFGAGLLAIFEDQRIGKIA